MYFSNLVVWSISETCFFMRKESEACFRGYFFLGGRITLVKACLSGTWVCFVFN